jgi:hypothetical protein
LTIRSGVDNNYDGVSGDFADYKGGAWQLPNNRSKQDQIAHWFNTSVFAANTVGTIGTARRGCGLRGIFKNFQITERKRLQLRIWARPAQRSIAPASASSAARSIRGSCSSR